MATRVTIILDCASFLPADPAQDYLDCGLFENQGASDFAVSADGGPIYLQPNIKLGKGNQRIDVEHIALDGTLKVGVNRSPFFESDLLSTLDLYQPMDEPDFLISEYDCILRFHSGFFESSDVRARTFKERRVSDDAVTGNKLVTRAIANDVLVEFDLVDGEILRLTRNDGTNVWSSQSVSGMKRVQIKILADDTMDLDYFKKAFQLKGQHYFSPNPDPPPLGGGFFHGATLPGSPLSPARRYACPLGDYEKDVPFYDPFNPPFCPNHNTKLVRKP